MPRRRKGEAKPQRVIGNPGDPIGMAARLSTYLEWMLVRNYAVATVELRRYHVGLFIQWCEQRGVNRPTEVTKPIVERYQRWLFHYRNVQSGRPLGFRAQSQRLSHVRDFFRWLTRQNYLLYNPAADIELPRREKRLPRFVLTEAEVAKVLEQPDTSSSIGVRDRAILETLYSTGLRRRELKELRVDDLDAERGMVLVRLGKHKKDRRVPIGEQALAWIDRYLVEVRPRVVVPPDDGTLFLTNIGVGFRLDTLSAMAARYVDQAEVGKRGGCHLFRHTMATIMLERGADLRVIQEILGHTELSTTEVYTHVAIGHIKQVHAVTHPTAKLDRHPTTPDRPTLDEARQLALFDLLERDREELDA